MEKKYIIPVPLAIIMITGPLIPILVIGGGQPFTYLYPGGFGTQMGLVMLSVPISSMIGVLLGYIVAFIYLFIHKIIIGGGMTYCIEDRTKLEEIRRKKFYGMLKALFPALLAINIAFILSEYPEIQALVVRPNPNPVPNEPAEFIALANRLQTLFMISGLGMVIPMALFSGAWALLDAGIVFTNKNEV
ncbi:MAG: hypothetical protein ACFFDI_24050, partial [Promethearchaeota archaeon]